MDQVKPVRIQLSRKRGFRLQDHSRAINGLTAVKVDRSTNYGNPYDKKALGPVSNDLLVGLFRDHLKHDPTGFWREALPNLKGFNLACWCGPDEACHADVLLEKANAVLATSPTERKG